MDSRDPTSPASETAASSDLSAPSYQALDQQCLQASLQRRLFGRCLSPVTLCGQSIEVLRRLGTGASGSVYAVRLSPDEPPVALKVLRRQDAESVYRLKSEFRRLTALSHPNLIHFHDLYVDDSACAFTMELIEGPDLQTYCQGEGGLDPERVSDATVQLATGVEALHSHGLVHRDIKPANARITPDGRLVLFDFGVSDLIRTPETVGKVGTPGFVAPEVAAGQAFTQASDWYSVGATVDALLSLRHGERTSAPTVRRLRGLAHGLTAHSPGQRQNGHDIRACLGERATAGQRSYRPPLFVGREQEMSRLRGLRSVTPAVVVLHGPSGVGKSALADQVLSQWADETPEVVVLTGRAGRREALRFRAFDPLIDGLSAALGKLPASERAALCPKDLGLLVKLFPVLERANLAPGATSFGVDDARPLEPLIARQRGMEALGQLLHGLSELRTLVLCLDDLQWIDEESRDLLTALLGRPDPPRALVLAATRTVTGEASRWLAQLPCHVEMVEVGPLSDAHCTEILGAVHPHAGPDEHNAVLAAAQGSPFLLLELGKQLAQGGPDGQALPRSSEALLSQSLRALPGFERRLLELLTVAAEPLSPELAARVLDVGRHDVERTLHSLSTRRFARWSQASALAAEPYHERWAEAVEAQLSWERARSYHEQLAAALVGHPDARPESLAVHLAASGDNEGAAAFAAQAATSADDRLAFLDAVHWHRRVLQLTPHGPQAAESEMGLAYALCNLGRWAEAAEVYRAARRREPTDQNAPLRRLEAHAWVNAGMRKEARQALMGMLKAVGVRAPQSMPGALLSIAGQRISMALDERLGWSGPRRRYTRGATLERIDACMEYLTGIGPFDPVAAVALHTRAFMDAALVGTPAQRARSQAVESIFLGLRGRYWSSRQCMLRVQAEAADVDDPELHAFVESAGAFHAIMCGDFQQLLHCVGRAEAACLAHGRDVQAGLTTLQYMRGVAWLYLGRLDLQDYVERGVAEARDRLDLRTEVSFRAGLAIVWTFAGDTARSRSEVREALSRSDYPSYTITHWAGELVLAHLELYEQRPDVALTWLKRTWRRAQWRGLSVVPYVRATTLHSLGVAALSLAQRRGADEQRLLRAAARYAARLLKEATPYARTLGTQLQGCAAVARGDVAAGKAQLTAALWSFRQQGLELIAEFTQWQLWALEGTSCRHLTVASQAALVQRGLADPRAYARLYAPPLR